VKVLSLRRVVATLAALTLLLVAAALLGAVAGPSPL
jgi:hypothetical protein